jgi:chromosome segregation ATPase
MAEIDCMEKTSLADAVKRLGTALNQLETAVQRRMDADRSLNSLQDDLQRLGEDRSQLATSLDESEARASRLEDANKDVSRRLVTAMETIRTVLDAHGG